MRSEQSVTVSNSLIRAVQRLSLSEKRLLMLAISKIDSRKGIEQTVAITGTEYAEWYGVHPSTAYKMLKSAEDKLFDRRLVVPDITSNMVIRWIISCSYQTGTAAIRFHPDLDGYILNLESRFTRYLLSRACEFRHLYSWRLFELVLQFKKTGTVIMSVDDFKEIMEIPEVYHQDFGLIRSKIINPSIKEIREKDGLEISYEVTKTGRKVTGLTFTFPPEQQAALPLPAKKAASKPQGKPPLSTASAKKAEEAAELAHLEQLAKLAGVPIESLMKKEKAKA